MQRQTKRTIQQGLQQTSNEISLSCSGERAMQQSGGLSDPLYNLTAV